MVTFNEGDKVSWKWGNGSATGTIQSLFHQKTTRTIDGTEVVRHGTKDDPALYINVEDGNNVLKLASEVQKVK